MDFMTNFSYYSQVFCKIGRSYFFQLTAFSKISNFMLSWVSGLRFFFPYILRRNELMEASSSKFMQNLSPQITTSSVASTISRTPSSSSVEHTRPSCYFFEYLDGSLEGQRANWSNSVDSCSELLLPFELSCMWRHGLGPGSI